FVWNESNDTAKCSMDAESDQEDYFPYEIKEEESGEDVIVTHNLRMPKMLTPLEFYRRSKVDLDEIVHLTHIPYHEENMVLEGKEIKNMVGGKEFRGLNVNIDVIIQAIFQSIINGNAVPMAADVKHLDERVNFFSIQNDLKDEIFDFDSSIKLSKGDRLLYGATSCAHLMNIVGCDDPVENKLPVGIEEEYGRLWKIENSWEDQDELIMSDSWLREYGYEFFILKKYLPENLQRVWDNPKDRVKEITPQDPIGKF
ncbi:MAG: C1 family peptidase, partial [Waddliaceae bacterium]